MVSATRDEEGSDSDGSSKDGEGGAGGERGGGGERGRGREVLDGDKAESVGWVTATLERLGSVTEESKTSEEKGGGLDEKEKELDEDASEHGECGGGAV